MFAKLQKFNKFLFLHAHLLNAILSNKYVERNGMRKSWKGGQVSDVIHSRYTSRSKKVCGLLCKKPSNHECTLAASSFSPISFYLYKWEIDPGWVHMWNFPSTREHWPIDRLMMFTLRDAEERKQKKMLKNALKLFKLNVCACVYWSMVSVKEISVILLFLQISFEIFANSRDKIHRQGSYQF